MMSKYATELDIVQRFLAAWGIARPVLTDPNQGRTTDSGADVMWTRDQSVIGFQVTEYHSDEGRDPDQKGSQLRRNEKRRAAASASGVYTMWVVPDPIPAIVSRVAEKVGRARPADLQRFSELILLIASSLPHDGAGATFLLDAALEPNLPRLNAATHELLSRSAYNSAYIFNMLSLQGTPVVYEWDRESGWRRRGPAPSNEGRGQPAAKAQDVGLQAIRFLQSPGGPQPGPGSLSDGLGPTFFPELLKAFSDREPTRDEIEAFERSFRERSHAPRPGPHLSRGLEWPPKNT